MNVEDYLQSLEEKNLRYFDRPCDAFWTDTILDLMATLGPDTDADLERLVHQLRTYHRTHIEFRDEVAGMRHEIVRLRGPGCWRDNSALGLKYQVLNAIATTREENAWNETMWLYGIVTAFQRINEFRSEETEAMLLGEIQKRLHDFEAQHPLDWPLEPGRVALTFR